MAGAKRLLGLGVMIILCGISVPAIHADDWCTNSYSQNFSYYQFSSAYSFGVFPSYSCLPNIQVTSIPLGAPSCVMVAPQSPVKSTPPPPELPGSPNASVKPVPDKVPPITEVPSSSPLEPKMPYIAEKKGPIIEESRMPNPVVSAKGLCRVGFWNLTGHDLTLKIDGKTRTLARDRTVTLELPRMFRWQTDENEEKPEAIAEGVATYEVVIRP